MLKGGQVFFRSGAFETRGVKNLSRLISRAGRLQILYFKYYGAHLYCVY